MGCPQFTSDIKVGIYILVILFAWSSWVDINGLWVEIPLLVNELPESWNLPSYVTIIIQLANIGPIIYTILQRAAPNKTKEWPFVYVIIGVGCTACMLLAFLWDRTTTIGGETHSTAFLTLTAFLALVDCTSSVVFLPYMAQFSQSYMTAYYIGEGFSGLIPGLVGLIQGVGSEPDCVNTTVVVTNETTLVNTTEYQVVAVYEEPLFGIREFFIFLFSMLVVSGVAFTILHFTEYGKRERRSSDNSYDISADGIDNTAVDPETEKDKRQEAKVDNHSVAAVSPKESVEKAPASFSLDHLPRSGSKESLHDAINDRLPFGSVAYLLITVAWVNAIMNGVLPSTQSYTCLPYGNLAYTLAIRLSTVASPLMSFLALFLPTRSLKIITLFSLIGTGLTAYQLYLAAMSPFPPLKNETSGVALVIVTSIVIAGLFAYIKVTIATMLANHGGKKSLLWCGGMTQVGSCLGAVITFLVINVGNVFESEPDCPY